MTPRSLSAAARRDTAERAMADILDALRVGPLHVVTIEVTRGGTHYLAVFGVGRKRHTDGATEHTHEIHNLTWAAGIVAGLRVVDRCGTWHLASGGYGFSRKTEIAENVAHAIRAHVGDDVPEWLAPILAAPQSHLVSGGGW